MKIVVSFMENGGEYEGRLNIDCEEFEQVDDKTILVNGARIEIDEPIIDIR